MDLPVPEFELLWKYGEYKVTKPGIEAAECFTASQMREYGEACAKAEREACAEVCMEVWTGATNERPTWLQNSYSHGCLASRDAIRMRSNYKYPPIVG